MKKAVGHLVPFMEKEREAAQAISGEVASENVICRFLLLVNTDGPDEIRNVSVGSFRWYGRSRHG